jgi:CO/xanthine dehydrogenase FAD-binding subunit
VLEGRRFDADVAGQAARAATIGATPLAKTAYKLPIIETLVHRAVQKAASLG